MQKILTNSTTKAQLYNHHVLVSVDEIEKEKLASVREKTQELSISPLLIYKIETYNVYCSIPKEGHNVLTYQHQGTKGFSTKNYNN